MFYIFYLYPMNFSYWETDSWLQNTDFTVVGSGIVGLNCAWTLKQRFPKAKILILERGLLPHGASTRNGGFATFGSLSEIISDLRTHSEQEIMELINKRREGLNLLRENLGDRQIGYREYGGTELFAKDQISMYHECFDKREFINKMLYPLFGAEVFKEAANKDGFRNILSKSIFTPFEGQIHTGQMMSTLLQKVLGLGVKILNKIRVEDFDDSGERVLVHTDQFTFSTRKLLIATNGFSSKLDIPNVLPARSQILITQPIKNLHIKGTYHLQEGFYYFRNVGNRLLLGGGRNLDLKGEQTTVMEHTSMIQDNLERLLREVILPKQDWEIEQRWSGIMGVGNQKRPIIRQLSNNTYCGVRLGGMGVAIGSGIGKDLANLI